MTQPLGDHTITVKFYRDAEDDVMAQTNFPNDPLDRARRAQLCRELQEAYAQGILVGAFTVLAET
jgi:hypothetical protein